jgi:cell wall-associated NlpC family hydrolase
VTFPFWNYAKIPYRNGGRDRSGCDCWGLLRLVYLEEWGITLPSYADDYQSAEDLRAVARTLNDRLADGWRPLRQDEQPLPGDGVVFAPDIKHSTHVGVVVGRILGDLSFLHVRHDGATSSVESMSRPEWRAFCRGIYRNLELERQRCSPPSP